MRYNSLYEAVAENVVRSKFFKVWLTVMAVVIIAELLGGR